MRALRVKHDEKSFLFCFKSLLLRYLDFSPHFFGNVGKQLDKKAKPNFKIYDVLNWETINYSKCIKAGLHHMINHIRFVV